MFKYKPIVCFKEVVPIIRHGINNDALALPKREYTPLGLNSYEHAVSSALHAQNY